MKSIILVVDDEPDIVELLADQLEVEGYSVFRSYGGHEAIETLKHHPEINSILSDYRMPNGDGRTVLEFVNKIPEESRPKFFFVSAHSIMTEEEALNSGVKKFIHKPFDFSEVLHIFKELDSKK